MREIREGHSGVVMITELARFVADRVGIYVRKEKENVPGKGISRKEALRHA